MSGFPSPPTGLPGFDPLIAGDLWRRWATGGRVWPLPDLPRAVRYLRLKPGVSCRLAVFAPGATTAGLPRGARVHLFADEARAEQAFEKLRPDEGRAGDEPAAFLDRRHAAVVGPFLDDPELPRLRDLRSRYRIRRWLEEAGVEKPRLSKRAIGLHLLRYKPGRRAVWRVDLAGRPRFHLRVEHPATTVSHANAVERLRLAGAAASVPRLRWLDGERGLLLRDWCSGRVWGEVHEPAELRRSSVDVGIALARLHDLPDAGATPRFEWRSPTLCERSDDLAALLPSLGPRLRRLAERLDAELAGLPQQVGWTHGDLHPQQVLLDPDGVRWLDLDRAHRDLRATDLAGCRVQDGNGEAARMRAEGLLAGYSRAARYVPTERELSVVDRALRFTRLGAAFRELRPDWPHRFLRGLDALERAPEPEVATR